MVRTHRKLEYENSMCFCLPPRHWRRRPPHYLGGSRRLRGDFHKKPSRERSTHSIRDTDTELTSDTWYRQPTTYKICIHTYIHIRIILQIARTIHAYIHMYCRRKAIYHDDCLVPYMHIIVLLLLLTNRIACLHGSWPRCWLLAGKAEPPPRSGPYKQIWSTGCTHPVRDKKKERGKDVQYCEIRSYYR